MSENKAPERVVEMREAWAAGDAKRDAGLMEPENLVKYKNLRYSDHGDFGLLDVYIPEGTEKKLPVLIDVHGGGYFYGDKELYRFYCMDMAGRGFVVVNFNYRLSPEYHFPAALTDINSVMVWVEKHADEYYMDTDRVFMMGDSAGAQLTSHYAAINSNPEFATLTDFEKHNIKLKAISLACGMYDVRKRLKTLSEDQLWQDYLGDGFDVTDKRLDVLGAVTSDYPATYLFSCPNDFLYAECEPMGEFLRSRGVKAVSRIYGKKDMAEVGHVFHCNMRLPIGAEARKDQAEFLLKA